MPADAYENALTQLKNLKHFLTSNVNLKDRKSLEVVMLIAMARQVHILHFILYNFDLLTMLYYSCLTLLPKLFPMNITVLSLLNSTRLLLSRRHF